MGTHKNGRGAGGTADWEITLFPGRGDGDVAKTMMFRHSKWRRDKDGWFTVSDAAGVMCEFSYSTVARVRRVDAAEGDEGDGRQITAYMSLPDGLSPEQVIRVQDAATDALRDVLNEVGVAALAKVIALPPVAVVSAPDQGEPF